MDELSDYTGYLLRNAFLRAAGLATQIFPRGEHPREAAVLATLEAMGPCAQQQVGDALNVNRTVMVKLIDSLEARGLVERRRNPDDRRSYALLATDEGRATLAGMGPTMDRAEAALTARLAAGERARLVALLQRLTGEPPPAMVGRLGFLLTRAHHRFRERADAVLAPLGIEVRHFGALTVLGAGEPSSQRALADRLGVSGPVVVEIVDALEQRGLVERRRDPADRRNNALHVTAAGRAALDGARAGLNAATAELTAPIGADGERELNALLRKLLG